MVGPKPPLLSGDLLSRKGEASAAGFLDPTGAGAWSAELPVYDDGPSAASSHPGPSDADGEVVKRILIVEDDELNLKFLNDFLVVHGYRTALVRDGLEALERVHEARHDLIVIDVQLPGLSGLELIARFKADAALKEIPVIVVSALARKELETTIRSAGCEDYISKPISAQAFSRQYVDFWLETGAPARGGAAQWVVKLPTGRLVNRRCAGTRRIRTRRM